MVLSLTRNRSILVRKFFLPFYAFPKVQTVQLPTKWRGKFKRFSMSEDNSPRFCFWWLTLNLHVREKLAKSFAPTWLPEPVPWNFGTDYWTIMCSYRLLYSRFGKAHFRFPIQEPGTFYQRRNTGNSAILKGGVIIGSCILVHLWAIARGEGALWLFAWSAPSPSHLSAIM